MFAARFSGEIHRSISLLNGSALKLADETLVFDLRIGK